MPLDGEVLEGKSAVDESMATGESLPVEKQPASQLIGGTLAEGKPRVVAIVSGAGVSEKEIVPARRVSNAPASIRSPRR